MRKHKGINQKTGKLKKGYRYSGKKLKGGLSEIVKVKKVKKKIQHGGERLRQVGGEYDLEWIKKQVKILKNHLKTGAPSGENSTGAPLTGMEKVKTQREIRKLIQQYNHSIKKQDDLTKILSDYPVEKVV